MCILVKQTVSSHRVVKIQVKANKNFGDTFWWNGEGTVRGDVTVRCAVSLAAAEAVLSKMADSLSTGLVEEKETEKEDRERATKAVNADQNKKEDGVTDTRGFHDKNGGTRGQKGNLSGESHPGFYNFTKQIGCWSCCFYLSTSIYAHICPLHYSKDL